MGEDYRPSRRRICLSRNSSSFAEEQFHNDASLKAVHQTSPNNLKNKQRTMESDVSEKLLTRAPYGGEWSYNFLQTVGSRLVYCYKCTSVRLRQFVNVCHTVDCVPWWLYTGSPSWQTIDGCIYNGQVSTQTGKLISIKLSSVTLKFVGQWRPRSC